MSSNVKERWASSAPDRRRGEENPPPASTSDTGVFKTGDTALFRKLELPEHPPESLLQAARRERPPAHTEAIKNAPNLVGLSQQETEVFIKSQIEKPDPAITRAVILALRAEQRNRHFEAIRHREISRTAETFKNLASEWRTKAHTDDLTDIPNKRLFIELLKKRHNLDKNTSDFDAPPEEFADYAVAFIDLNGFKQINDSYGHQVGDNVLRVVGAHFKIILNRSTDTIARLGGDEFGILLVGAPGQKDFTKTLAKIEGKQSLYCYTIDAENNVILVSPPKALVDKKGLYFVFEDNLLLIRYSVGLSYVTDPNTNPLAALKTADAEMYKGKPPGSRDAAPVTSVIDHTLT